MFSRRRGHTLGVQRQVEVVRADGVDRADERRASARHEDRDGRPVTGERSQRVAEGEPAGGTSCLGMPAECP